MSCCTAGGSAHPRFYPQGYIWQRNLKVEFLTQARLRFSAVIKKLGEEMHVHWWMFLEGGRLSHF